jgi:hypothetical protein
VLLSDLAITLKQDSNKSPLSIPIRTTMGTDADDYSSAG